MPTESLVAVFSDNLTSVSFLHDGTPVDVRAVLNGLAFGALRITHSQEIREPAGPIGPAQVVSETWRVIPAP